VDATSMLLARRGCHSHAHAAEAEMALARPRRPG
jgi:hypothetical protein